MSYTFRDSDTAARRLRLLAEVYRESTREFFVNSVMQAPELVVDLGCGPGYTTHLLAEATGSRRAVGMDSSAKFVEAARPTSTERVSFVMHDVTAAPFPVGPADLLFCRFLLTHLTDPAGALSVWASQLRPAGLLLVEEVERINTEDLVLSKYLEILTAVLDDQGHRLYIGPTLDALEPDGGLQRKESSVRRVEVPAARAAQMFVMNIVSWREREFVKSNFPADEIDGLARDLARLAAGYNAGSVVEWGLRQMVWERT